MRSKPTLLLILLALAVSFGLSAGEASAVLYTFDSNPPPDWGNERGNWIASGGVYYAQAQAYPNYTSLPFNLTDFTFTVDLHRENGIWLHSDYNGGNINGLLFVVDRYGNAYWHDMHNGVQGGPYNVAVLHMSGTIHIKIVVEDDHYAAYRDDTLLTSIVNNEFPSGRVGLFSNLNVGGGTFDNANLVPIPSALFLMGTGLLSLGVYMRRKKS